jgi:hypothetical protein
MTPWLDDEDVPPEVRRLLEVGSGPEPLPGEAFARSRRRLTALAAAPLAAGAFFWAQQFALGAGLGIAVSLGVAAAQGTFARTTEPQRPPPSASASANAGAVTAPNSPRAALPAASSEPSSPPRELVEPRTRPLPASSAEDPLTAEAGLLEQARRSLASDPALSLALLDEHARRFPRGMLHVEREVLAIDALVRGGRRAEAEARAARLRAAAPGSLYQARLARILGK